MKCKFEYLSFNHRTGKADYFKFEPPDVFVEGRNGEADKRGGNEKAALTKLWLFYNSSRGKASIH